VFFKALFICFAHRFGGGFRIIFHEDVHEVLMAAWRLAQRS